jgi:microcystin-dependent protein
MDPFVGQLALVGFNFAPYGWQVAAGQLLPLSSNTALFSLLGTYYGGDGRTTFALPNLQGNVALGYGQGTGLSNYDLGQRGGSPSVTLLSSETPNHTHALMASGSRGNVAAPAGNSFSDAKEAGSLYTPTTTPATAMSASAVSTFPGGSQPHNNMMSFLGMYWIIAMVGVFPQRS